MPSDSNDTSEEIPDPERLVVPGYNLPENIFNKGKPFYLEKDPLTGAVNFNNKSPSLDFDNEEYDYIEDEPNSDIYAKSNINRKDGSLLGHKPSDVNQLVPNFHDFLHLPVKYNPDKYVYPLISNSYANTKIQGNINKQYNHKEYSATTYRPTASPTYYTTKAYYNNYQASQTPDRYPSTTKKPSTTKPLNLMNSPTNHPSFEEEYPKKTEKLKPNHPVTKPSTPSTTTKSLFEQLFGDFDVIEPTVKPFSVAKATTQKYPEITTKSQLINNNITSFEEESYDYADYNEYPATDNVAVESKPSTPTKIEFKPNKSENKYEKPVEKYKPEKPKEEVKNTNKKQTYSEIDDSYFIKSEDNKFEVINQTEYPTIVYSERVTSTTTPTTTTTKVTSLPLGENHVTHNNRQPIIVATSNLKEQLNNEKIPQKPFGYDKGVLPPSTSNIHIAPDQDVVSFVVGNHQNVGDGQYVGATFKESPYDHNPFRPLYVQPDAENSFNYPLPNSNYQPAQNIPKITTSSVTILPIRNSEASLAIGMPVSDVKVQIPGQVVDDNLDIAEEITYPKGTGSKIVFPDENQPTTLPPDLNQPNNLHLPPVHPLSAPPNREVLQLNSKPMFHQLPSDLTPPSEKEVVYPPRLDRIRPPWDPRPGHFYSGRPEYARPPRPPLPPPSAEIYKRIDNLPNILPQFRPNARISNAPHYYENPNKKPFLRQPLLERPSNKPLGFFEKLHPPPPPKNLHNLRPHVDQELKLRNSYHQNNPGDDRNIIENSKKPVQEFGFYQSPPKIVLANRRQGDEEPEVETLQMIQAKQAEKKEVQETTTIVKANLNGKDSVEKPLYVVYPINTPPLKLDVIDNNKKEAVVIGTRAELPLPPSEINQFPYEQTPLLNTKDRKDAPILKPHPRPSTFPIRSDFPYPIERPDPSMLTETPTNNKIDLTDKQITKNSFESNQWNTLENVESRIITNKLNTHGPNQISVTLKTYTEKPIAVAYTPTEPHDDHPDKYSMPNYGGSVIPEIRPGDSNSEFTVSAVMHTHPHIDMATQNMDFINKHKQEDNHRLDNEMYTTHVPAQDFQAPFQASVNLDSISQGWSVIRDKNKQEETSSEPEATTISVATSSEFDIENFKPQLIGGFKPIYEMTEDENKKNVSERQE